MTSNQVLCPTLTKAEENAATPGVSAYETGRWGTYKMGAPSNPQAHPDNQQAATWQPLLHDDVERIVDEKSEHIEHTAFALTQNAGSSTTEYAVPPTTQANPYVGTTPAPSYNGKSSGDIIYEYLKKWSKKFEVVVRRAHEMAGNIWQHLRTGPSIADVAWGKLNQGTILLTEGGYENFFRHTFETIPDEKLCKSYACYLSTTSGPVAGTLFISTVKIAFYSDRPLSYSSSCGETAWCYYKVVLPLIIINAINPSANRNNPSERYIQLVTVDDHEFWFMGFVSYDKALQSLQDSLETHP